MYEITSLQFERNNYKTFDSNTPNVATERDMHSITEADSSAHMREDAVAFPQQMF